MLDQSHRSNEGTEKGDKLTTTLNSERKFEEMGIRVYWGGWKLCDCHLEVWGGAKAGGGVTGLEWVPGRGGSQTAREFSAGLGLAQKTSELLGGPPGGPEKPRSPAAEPPNAVLP